jgi:hypothetical protein
MFGGTEYIQIIEEIKNLSAKVDTLLADRAIMKKSNDPETYSTEEVMKLFHIKSPTTIISWKKRGKIKPINRNGRNDCYLKSDIHKLLKTK